MARPRRKPPPEESEVYTLVRGADGALYLISKTTKPLKLTGEKKEKAVKILNDCEDKLSDIGPPGTRNIVHVGVPTIFVKHK